ncbi:MAG TPA: anthranilate synthase component I family protein [Bacteroidales bacterium]
MADKYTFRFITREQPADALTPVGIYLRIRDLYPGSLLLECADYSSRTNAFSYICINPVLGIEAKEDSLKSYFPGDIEKKTSNSNLIEKVNDFVGSIEVISDPEKTSGLHCLFGFTSFNASLLFEKFDTGLMKNGTENSEVPILKYDFYKVVLTFNHFNETLTITEYYNDELPLGEYNKIISLLANHNFTSYPFKLENAEESLISDDYFKNMVTQAKLHCARGDVFQLVVSRRFKQCFSGDEFNVYRALRSINPSPYLFYFDYIAFKIFGSSPEAQLKVENGQATINPIAGTIRRTGDALADLKSAKELLDNPKENSEHVMLVDLARNDLSRCCTEVKVDIYKELQAFSHLWHLVSTVSGKLNESVTPFTVFAKTFPAGTLSGAPKHRAIELISAMEKSARGYYGGAIGYIGLNGSLNHAIIIRSFLSREGTLSMQAGAGVVINSNEEGELKEVSNKLDALHMALEKAGSFVNY